MYTYEDRIKAVNLLIQYNMRYSHVVRELGYPTVQGLRNWYKEFSQSGDLHKACAKTNSYTDDQKLEVIGYYIEHGRNISQTRRYFGYPSRITLREWIRELIPEEAENHCFPNRPVIKYSHEQKEQAVIELCSHSRPVKEIAESYGTTCANLYHWKRQLLKKMEYTQPMKDKQKSSPSEEKTFINGDINALMQQLSDLKGDVTSLKEERDALKNEVYRLKMERDIYEKAAEVIKKDQGVNISTLKNREKAIIINALRDRYPLKDLLVTMKMAKSSYCYQVIALNTDKYKDYREKIRSIFVDSQNRYGYRRIHSALKSETITLSEKVIRAIMHEEHLEVYQSRKKKYSSYKGEITPAVPNVIARDFHADSKNEKWLTDITEFGIPAGKIYLSPIIDCFDGMPVSWTIGTSPDAELVNTMLDNAITTLEHGEHPLVHSDRGAHYRWPGWIDRMEAAGLTRSMSKKGCSPDNSACEGFFGILKNEMFYGIKWNDVSIEDFIKELDEYMHWFVEKRIKISLGGMSPLDYRKSLGLLPA